MSTTIPSTRTQRRLSARSCTHIVVRGIAALTMILAMVAPAAAQVTMGVSATDALREALQDREAVSPAELYELMSRGIQYEYRGEEPIEGRFLIFFVSAEGSVRGQVAGRPIRVRPGDGGGLGRSLSEDAFVSFYEEVAGLPFYPAIPAIPPKPDLFVEAEELIRPFGDSWSPEQAAAWAQALNDSRGDAWESGIGVALVPIIGRYVEANLSELRVGMMGVASRRNGR